MQRVRAPRPDASSLNDRTIEGSPSVTGYTLIRGRRFPGTVSDEALDI